MREIISLINMHDMSNFKNTDNKNKYLCAICEFWISEAVITEDILIILHTTLSIKEPFPIGIDV